MSSEPYEERLDNSIVTMLEKTEDISADPLWDHPLENTSKDEDRSYSEEEIHTYRISNPTTPIQDLDQLPSEIDLSMLWNDPEKNHLINNLLYGNIQDKLQSMAECSL